MLFSRSVSLPCTQNRGFFGWSHRKDWSTSQPQQISPSLPYLDFWRKWTGGKTLVMNLPPITGNRPRPQWFWSGMDLSTETSKMAMVFFRPLSRTFDTLPQGASDNKNPETCEKPTNSRCVFSGFWNHRVIQPYPLWFIHPYDHQKTMHSSVHQN